MIKILFAIALLSGTTSLFAAEMDSESRLTGTFPEMKPADESERKAHIGLLTGISSPKGETTSTTAYGFDVGYQPYVPFGVGLEANTAKLDDAEREQRTTVLAKGTYNFGGDIPVIKDTYVGAGAGPIFVSNKVKWGVAPLAGFDIPLAQKTHDFVSLGLNAKYVFSNETPDSFISALALKYWF